MTKLNEYIISLIYAELHNKNPESIPAGITYKEIMDFAFNNKIDNIVYRSLSRIDDEFSKEYEDIFDWTIQVEAVQQIELDFVIEKFSANKIKHIPMKGSYLKNFYPSPDMRQQGDIDILVERKNMVKCRKLLIELGYTFKEHDDYEGHDVFYKDKSICLELHSDLLKPIDIGFKRYKDIWSRAIKRENSGFCYDITQEDIYIYMILHMIKHLSEGGAGIRMLIDIWIMDQKWGNNLNYDIMREYAVENGIAKAFDSIREIASCWFENKKIMSEHAQNLGEYIIQSSVYGSKDEKHFIDYSKYENMDVSNITKFRDMFSRVFKRYNLMRKEFDILNKYPWLLPVMWVYRLFRIVFTQRYKITGTVDEYKNIDSEKLKEAIKYNEQIKLIVGIDD